MMGGNHRVGLRCVCHSFGVFGHDDCLCWMGVLCVNRGALQVIGQDSRRLSFMRNAIVMFSPRWVIGETSKTDRWRSRFQGPAREGRDGSLDQEFCKAFSHLKRG